MFRATFLYYIYIDDIFVCVFINVHPEGYNASEK